jgi:hypothetical protein
MGVDVDLLDSGCCGMAGSFGFDKDKFEVSVRIGELVLLPEVRAAKPETLIVTNGYSCREQIEQCGGRRAMHLAEVLQMAIRASKKPSARLHHAEKSEGAVEIWRLNQRAFFARSYRIAAEVSPPSTTSSCPVTKRASSLARNAITSATSSGSP